MMNKKLKVGDFVKTSSDFSGKVLFIYTRHRGKNNEEEWALVEWEDDDTSNMPVSNLRKSTIGFTYCIGDVLIGENRLHYEIINHVIVKDDKFNVAVYKREEHGIILYTQRLIHEDDLDLYKLKK